MWQANHCQYMSGPEHLYGFFFNFSSVVEILVLPNRIVEADFARSRVAVLCKSFQQILLHLLAYQLAHIYI